MHQASPEKRSLPDRRSVSVAGPRKTYHTPQLRVFGDLRNLTKGSNVKAHEGGGSGNVIVSKT